jgi:hypothetical protein
VTSALPIGAALPAWHDFFVASTGAAAVLLGLTFVGLTIHVERRGLDSLRRGLAIGSATSLLYALFSSLLMLMPGGVPYVQAVGLVLIGLFGSISSQAALANARHGGSTRARLAFQFVLPGIAFALLVIAGVAMATGVEQAVWAAAVVVFLLITAGTQGAWDLLVSFAPEGRGLEEREAAAAPRAPDPASRGPGLRRDRASAKEVG